MPEKFVQTNRTAAQTGPPSLSQAVTIVIGAVRVVFLYEDVRLLFGRAKQSVIYFFAPVHDADDARRFLEAIGLTSFCSQDLLYKKSIDLNL